MLRLQNRIKYWGFLGLLILGGCQPLNDLGNTITGMFSGLVNSIRFPEFPSFR